jgi:hypothetical protein
MEKGWAGLTVVGWAGMEKGFSMSTYGPARKKMDSVYYCTSESVDNIP